MQQPAPNVESGAGETTSAHRRASAALCVLVGFHVMHGVCAALVAPREALTLANAVPGFALNAVLLGLVLWCAVGVRRGKRIEGATRG